MGGSLHLPAKVLSVYIEALMGLGHVVSPHGVNNNCCLKAVSLKQLMCASNGRNIHCKNRGDRKKPPKYLSPAHGSTKSPALSVTSSNTTAAVVSKEVVDMDHLYSSATYATPSLSSLSPSDGIGGWPDKITQALTLESLVIMLLSACDYCTYQFPMKTGLACAKRYLVHYLSAKHAPLCSPGPHFHSVVSQYTHDDHSHLILPLWKHF